MADLYRENFYYILDMPLNHTDFKKVEDFYTFILESLENLKKRKSTLKSLISSNTLTHRPKQTLQKTTYDSFFYNMKTLSE